VNFELYLQFADMFLCVCDVSFEQLQHFKRHNKKNNHIPDEFFPFSRFDGWEMRHFQTKTYDIGTTMSLRLYLKDVADPVPWLNQQVKRMAEILKNLTADNQIRMFLNSKTSMKKPLEEKATDFNYFRTASEQVLHLDAITPVVQRMVNFIGKSIEKHEGVGSGFKVHSTEYISLEIGFLKPSVYGAKVELPGIIPPSAVLDMTDVPENQCFKHAFLASKHYEGRTKQAKGGIPLPDTTIASYQKFEDDYKFPTNYPITKEEALRFCRRYNTRVCIFTYLEDSEDVATTCYTEAKDIRDVNKQNEMVSTYFTNIIVIIIIVMVVLVIVIFTNISTYNIFPIINIVIVIFSL
jgi:hypothetical protein